MAAQVSISELLARLNALRADLGKPALKAWKESRAKLEGELASYVKQAEAKLEADVKAKEAAEPAKPSPKAKPAKAKEAPKAKPAGEVFGLAELARELQMNPKVARAKARRHKAELAKLKVAGAEGWEFPAKAREQVIKVMKGEK